MPADLIAHGVAAATATTATTATTTMIPARGGAPRAGLGGDRADMGLARPPRQWPVNRWVGSRPGDAADRRPITSRTGWSGVRRSAGRPLPRREQGRGGGGAVEGLGAAHHVDGDVKDGALEQEQQPGDRGHLDLGAHDQCGVRPSPVGTRVFLGRRRGLGVVGFRSRVPL